MGDKKRGKDIVVKKFDQRKVCRGREKEEGRKDRVETMGTADDRTYDAGATAESDDSRENRDTAISMLHAVPGINKNNVYEVMARVDSLAALARMSVEELRPLLGLENARMCFAFFNTKT